MNEHFHEINKGIRGIAYVIYEHEQLVRRIVVALDCLAVGIAVYLPCFLQEHLLPLFPEELAGLYRLPPLQEYVWLFVIVVPLWITSLSYSGMYRSMREKRFVDVCWGIIEASLLSVTVFLGIVFFFKFKIITRTFIATLFLCILVALVAEKCIILLLLRNMRRRGYNSRTLLIAGSGKRARNFAHVIETHPQWGFRILGFIDEEERIGMKVGKREVIGSLKDLAGILDKHTVSEVVFLLPRRWLPSLEDSISICEKVGVKATVAIDLFNTAIAKPVTKKLGGIHLLSFDTTPHEAFHLLVKRLVDILVSLIALISSLPVFIISAVAIKLTAPGPVFFTQNRCGLYGKVFTLYKFRTMVVDADKMIDKVMHLNESKGPVFHARNDPRVTPVGRIVRMLSLDELPQLINVLKGDMSLIGPRPPLPEEVEKYERWQRRRLSFRPGIVCTWQVTNRFKPDFRQWMQMDLDYIDNWSLGLDLKILLKICPALFRGFIHWCIQAEKGDRVGKSADQTHS
ncbi:MAG: sugar transferase [Candidatus Brocadia sp.]|nr:sugar transferase [Candidatus Brocadia sp.]